MEHATEFRFSPKPNNAHLIKWRPWERDVLEEAKGKGNLILLSVSAVWCHWCHVMDETAYSDSEVIDLINGNFIPIRIDADMRPDIDSLYNQGGWPSTVILTPEGEIIHGRTYIPPEDMKLTLSRILEIYSREKESIAERINQLRERKGLTEIKASEPEREDISKILSLIKESYDRRYGGFGNSQKFPNPDTIDFLISGFMMTKDQDIKEIITRTLDGMAGGDIYDSVEGGFFRYSTRPDWSMPHYEKMLELNAGMIRNYAGSSVALKKKEYVDIAGGTIGYIKTNLYDERTGIFYGSQDADEEYYQRKDRAGLKPPYIDRTAYADSSSLMISALVSAYNVSGEEDFLRMSERASGFIIKELYSEEEGVFHSFRDNKGGLRGMLPDNVLLGSALIDLYNVTGDRKYYNTAEEIGRLLIGRYYDKEKMQFRPFLDTTVVNPATSGMLYDFNTVLQNYRALYFLSRLYYFNRDDELNLLLDNTIKRFAGSYERYDPYVSLYGTLLRWRLEDPLEVTIILKGEGYREFLSALIGIYIPEKVIRIFSPEVDADAIKKTGYPLTEAVYVCTGSRCLPPITEPGVLKMEILRFL